MSEDVRPTPNGERAPRDETVQAWLDELPATNRPAVGSRPEFAGAGVAPSAAMMKLSEPSPALRPSACACGGTAQAGRGLVFALGTLGVDLMSEARRDSIRDHMPAKADVHNPAHLLEHLDKNPWEAASITWTVLLDQTPIYGVRPSGPFATHVYDRLREFLTDQVAGKIERVSIPGRLCCGVTLIDGQVVPGIEPELRGMYSWTTSALREAVAGTTSDKTEAAKLQHTRKLESIHNFLERVYFELRNLGVTPEERAINYAATNAFKIGTVFHTAVRDEMELDAIEVERSPVCRPDSDCWDVKLLFFYPQRPVQTVRRAFRFTVDVSDVVPVTVGAVRSWFVR
jgi:cyanobactin maturation PatA/PatG family protease